MKKRPLLSFVPAKNTLAAIVALLVCLWADVCLAAHKRLANPAAIAVSGSVTDAETAESLRYLRAEYERATIADVRSSVVALMTTELNKSMLANVQQEYAFRVLDEAVVPNRRASPNRVLIAAAGVALGVAVGIALALMVDYRKRLRH